MNKKYGPFDFKQFPNRLLSKNYKKDVIAVEKNIMDDFGFSLQEVHYLIKNKPSILLYMDDYDLYDSGLRVIKEVMVDQLGYKESQMKELIL